jgi:uncharacterized protein (TIGR02217 family)
MSRPFLEEQISLDARYGTSFTETYDVNNTQDGGADYGQLLSPFPRLRYDLNFANCAIDSLAKQLRDLYHRSAGTFGGFRLKHHADFTTNNYTHAPTHTDQILIPVTTKIFQLVRWYGPQNVSTSARRIIYKPVTGTVKVGVAGALVTTGFTIDHAKGLVTFSSVPAGQVTAGCEYDIPVRFEAAYSGNYNTANVISTNLNVVELLNP